MIQARSALAWLLPTLIGAIGRGFVRRQTCFGVNLSDVKWSGWRWLFRLDVESRVMCSSRRGRWVIVWWVLVRPCVLIYILLFRCLGLWWLRPAANQMPTPCANQTYAPCANQTCFICMYLFLIWNFPHVRWLSLFVKNRLLICLG